MSTGVLVMVAAAVPLYLLVQSTFIHGAIVGAYVVGIPALVTFISVAATGTAYTGLGADAETWTAAALRRAHAQGWKLVNDVGLGKGNIDHVLVGPGGALVVETRWTSTPWDSAQGRKLRERGLTQVLANARSLRLWEPFRKIEVPVRALLVIWGPGAKPQPDERWWNHPSGATIALGPALQDVLQHLPSNSLDDSQVHRAWQALNRQIAAREAVTTRGWLDSVGRLLAQSFVGAMAAIAAFLVTVLLTKVFASLWVALGASALLSLVAAGIARLGIFVAAAWGWIVGILGVLAFAAVLVALA